LGVSRKKEKGDLGVMQALERVHKKQREKSEARRKRNPKKRKGGEKSTKEQGRRTCDRERQANLEGISWARVQSEDFAILKVPKGGIAERLKRVQE